MVGEGWNCDCPLGPCSPLPQSTPRQALPSQPPASAHHPHPPHRTTDQGQEQLNNENKWTDNGLRDVS